MDGSERRFDEIPSCCSAEGLVAEAPAEQRNRRVRIVSFARVDSIESRVEGSAGQFHASR